MYINKHVNYRPLTRKKWNHSTQIDWQSVGWGHDSIVHMFNVSFSTFLRILQSC